MHRYYYGLDGLRFFAAFAVCIFHLGFYVWASDYGTMAPIFDHRASFQAMTSMSWLGWVGVQIFFVISGFVIANSANGASPFDFLKGRLLRLWPAAWICATVTLCVRLLTGEDFWRDLDSSYLRSLLLWPKGEWIDGVYWSLAVEISFYALVFLLLLTRNFRHLPLLAWGLTLVSAAYLSLAALDHAGIPTQAEWFGALAAQSEILPIRHGVFFAIGIWLWMLSKRSMSGSAWVGLLIAMVFAMVEIEIRAWDMETIEAVASAGQPVIAPLLVWFAAIGLMIAFTRMPERFTPAREVDRERLNLLGKLTYPLYLVHSAVGAAAMAAMIDAGVHAYAALVLAIALVLGIAALVALHGESLARMPLKAMLAFVEAAALRAKPLGLLFRRSDTVRLKQG